MTQLRIVAWKHPQTRDANHAIIRRIGPATFSQTVVDFLSRLIELGAPRLDISNVAVPLEMKQASNRVRNVRYTYPLESRIHVETTRLVENPLGDRTSC